LDAQDSAGESAVRLLDREGLGAVLPHHHHHLVARGDELPGLAKMTKFLGAAVRDRISPILGERGTKSRAPLFWWWRYAFTPRSKNGFAFSASSTR